MYIDKTIKRVIIHYLKYLHIAPTTVREKIFKTIKGRDRANSRPMATKYNPILTLRSIKEAFSRKSVDSPSARNTKNRFRLSSHQLSILEPTNIISNTTSSSNPDNFPLPSESSVPVVFSPLISDSIVSTTHKQSNLSTNSTNSNPTNRANDIDSLIMETLTHCLELDRGETTIASLNPSRTATNHTVNTNPYSQYRSETNFNTTTSASLTTNVEPRNRR
uniref:Uncharacterized protein n=1 Tax=Lygus hesperus TaxID=30085 RepID=A0A0A9XZR7_LYGHE